MTPPAVSLALFVLVASASCAGTPPPVEPTTAGVPELVHLLPGVTYDVAAARACLATAEAKRTRFSGEAASINVKHVLVKYAGAKNASPAIKRVRQEACLRAIEARDKVRGGAEFADVVKEYSDEAGAATREGSLGAIERKDVAKPFADAAFELSANQLSDVVETEFGFHVILRVP